MPRAKALVPGPTEAAVLAGTLAALRLYGLAPERRNTGGLTNPKGQYVAFNAPGTPDVDVVLSREFAPHAAGKVLRIECKRGGWRPGRARGAERARFEAQLARLKRVNDEGGYGFWCDDPAQVIHVLGRIRDGWTIEFDGRGYPVLVGDDE